MIVRGLFFSLLALLGLISCTSVPRRSWSPAVSGAAKPVPTKWSFEGRLAVSNGKDSGSGRIRWEQDGKFFTISLRAPISGQSWQLSGDSSHARLEGVRPYPVLGTSARELLRRELGWELPVGAMETWLFGRGFTSQARLQHSDAGELVEVDDSGWNIVYRNWETVEGVAVPGRVLAKNSPYQVRLAIQRWHLNSGVAGREVEGAAP